MDRIRIHIRVRRKQVQDWIRIHVIGNVEYGAVDSEIFLKMPPDGNSNLIV
jgi:hypothetical protein